MDLAARSMEQGAAGIVEATREVEAACFELRWVLRDNCDSQLAPGALLPGATQEGGLHALAAYHKNDNGHVEQKN